MLVAVIFVLWAWVLPMAHAMPIDADGPSGLSDNADLDDLIVSLTSPTAAAAPVRVLIIPARFSPIETIARPKAIPVRHIVLSSVAGRAPPLV
jgi:hypothetical protein